MSTQKACSIICALLLSPAACAEPAYLVKEIRAGTNASPWGGSSPVFAAIDATLLTYADDGVKFLEPWISDGSDAGTQLLVNISAGNGVSFDGDRRPTVVLDKAFFFGNDGFLGFEPWATDGTPAATEALVDLAPGSGDASINNFVRYLEKAWFIARFDLWSSDGTAAGTTKVYDSASVNSSSATLFVWKGRLRWLEGNKFMTSDGTGVGTIVGQTLPAGVTSPFGNFVFVPVNDVLYFSATDAAAGAELWRTDWTTTGTTRVADIVMGPGSSSAGALIRRDDQVLFGAETPAEGGELWRSDGTEAGTQLVKDIRAGNIGSTIGERTALNGIVYFVANDGVEGLELWRSDGTEVGTTLVEDIEPEPSPQGSITRSLTRVGDRLVLQAHDGAHGVEPWISDGTGPGTTLFDDVNPGTSGSNPGRFIAAGGRVFFNASNGATFNELFAKNAYDSADAQPAACDVPQAGMHDLSTETFQLSLPAFAGDLSDLDLSFDITHTYVNDLQLTLTHVPSGVSALVVNKPRTANNGACNGDNINLRLDDQAATALALGCTNTLPAYPRRASRRPDAPLAAFSGRSIAGPWRLTVTDGVLGDAAIVHDWCLHFTRLGDTVFADGFE